MAPLGIQFCTWAAIVLVRTEWCALFVALLSAAAAVRGTVSTAIFLSSFLTVVVVSPAKDFATAATEDGIIGALDSSTVVPLAAAVGGNRGGGGGGGGGGSGNGDGGGSGGSSSGGGEDGCASSSSEDDFLEEAAMADRDGRSTRVGSSPVLQLKP